jgi:hypothetical protein
MKKVRQLKLKYVSVWTVVTTEAWGFEGSTKGLEKIMFCLYNIRVNKSRVMKLMGHEAHKRVNEKFKILVGKP